MRLASPPAPDLSDFVKKCRTVLQVICASKNGLLNAKITCYLKKTLTEFMEKRRLNVKKRRLPVISLSLKPEHQQTFQLLLFHRIKNKKACNILGVSKCVSHAELHRYQKKWWCYACSLHGVTVHCRMSTVPPNTSNSWFKLVCFLQHLLLAVVQCPGINCCVLRM